MKVKFAELAITLIVYERVRITVVLIDEFSCGRRSAVSLHQGRRYPSVIQPLSTSAAGRASGR